MRRILLTLGLACGLCLMTQTADAGIVQGTILVTIDGVSNGVPIGLGDDGKTGIVEGYVVSTGEGSVEVTAALDPDPEIVFALTVTDIGNPSVFGISFTEPIVATAAPGIVTSSLAGNTTGVDGVNLGAVAPGLGIPVDSDATTEIMVLTLSQDGGLSLLNAGIDVGPSATQPPGSATYGTLAGFTGGPAAGPALAGSYNLMRVDVSFSLSGGGDIAGLSGQVTVNQAAPEPAAALLLALGLGAVLFHRRLDG